MPETPVRAAVYLRISFDQHQDGLAIKRQREDCYKIVEDRGWELIEEYVDRSKSATDKTKKREDYDRMVADFHAGRFDAIVCWDLDRLTRQPRQLEDWIDAAQEQSLQLVTANGEADLTTDGGRMYARVKAAIARGEVERKSERQSRAHLQRAQRGRAPKGQRPLGYATNGDVIEHEAVAVREMFRLFAVEAGTPLTALARALSGEEGPDVPRTVPHLPKHTRTVALERNERRLEEGDALRPVPEDGPWSPSTVHGILRNARYAGYSSYSNKKDRTTKNKRRTGADRIVRDEHGRPVKGQWEPLIDELTWMAVQDRLDDQSRVTNRTGSTARKHLGASIYLCGVCGRKITSHSRGYRCKEGGHVTRSREHVDDYVLRVARARLARPDLRNVLPSRDEPRMRAIELEIEERQGVLKRVAEDYYAGHVKASDLAAMRDRHEPVIAELEVERLRLSSSTELSSVFGAADPVQAFDDADLAVKRRVIDFLFEIRLLRHPRGRKGFDPATVVIAPKQRG